MFKWIGLLFDRLFALAGALVFLQFPLFVNDYSQQLTGRVSELHLQVKHVQEIAGRSGKTLEQYIAKFLSSSDADFFHQGELLQAIVDRWHYLSNAMTALTNASIFSRPFVFFSNVDIQIAKDTFQSFKFGIPFTVEGAVFAVIGMAIGLLTFYCLLKLFKIGFRLVSVVKSKAELPYT